MNSVTVSQKRIQCLLGFWRTSENIFCTKDVCNLLGRNGVFLLGSLITFRSVCVRACVHAHAYAEWPKGQTVANINLLFLGFKHSSILSF